MSDLFPDDPLAIQARREAVRRGYDTPPEKMDFWEASHDVLINAPLRALYGVSEGAASTGAWLSRNVFSPVANLPNNYLETPDYFRQSDAQRRLTDPGSARQTGLSRWFEEDAAAWFDEQAAIDRRAKNLRTPDPRRVSEAQRLLSGITETVSMGIIGAPMGALGPSFTLASGLGASAYNEQIDQGVDERTAQEIAVEQGGFGAVMGVLPAAVPIRGGRFALWPALGRAASGSLINVGVGMGMRQSLGDHLRSAGYAEQAERYRWDDGQALVTDAVVGAIFGAVMGHVDGSQSPRQEPRTRGGGADGAGVEPIAQGPHEYHPPEWYYEEGRQLATNEDLEAAYAHALIARDLGHPEAQGLLDSIAEEGGQSVVDDGSAFASILALRDGLFEPSQDQIDAALMLQANRHARIDTAPGIPLDNAAEARHAESLARAERQIADGEEVDVGSLWADPADGEGFAPHAVDYEAEAVHEEAVRQVLEEEGFADLSRDVEAYRARIRQMGGDIAGEEALFSMGSGARRPRTEAAPRESGALLTDSRLNRDQNYAASRSIDGKSPRQIATEMDATAAYVRVLLSQARSLAPDLNIPRGRPGRSLDGLTERARKLRAKGMSYAEIGEALGMTAEAAKSRVNLRRADDPRYSMGGAFESAVERAVVRSTTARASGDQWWATISKATGVKREELEWLGLEDWLKAQEGPVSREDLLQFVRENGVRVEETVLGSNEHSGSALTPEEQRQYLQLIEEKDRLLEELRDLATKYDGWVTVSELARQMGYDSFTDPATGRVRADVDAAFDAQPGRQPMNAIQARINNEIEPQLSAFREKEAARTDLQRESRTRWSQYTLPGGSNYRELLLRLPERDTITREPSQAPNGWGDTAGGNQGFVERGNTGADFRSSHWDAPNVLAHVRFNERTDSQGRRTLFIEEVQSDWHQGGRERGYRTKSDTESLVAERMGDGGPWQVRSRNGDVVGTYMRDTAEQAIESAVGWLREVDRGVPDAPFKNNAWAALSLKRMIRYAAENGFDQIAWTRGDHQEQRFWPTLPEGASALREVLQPESVRQQAENYLGREMAIVARFEVMNAAVLAASKHDEIFRAVVEAIPVDVVNVLINKGVSPDQFARNPNMFSEVFTVNDRATVAMGLTRAQQLVGARLRTALERVLAPEATGRDGKLLSTIRASDLNAREVAGLLSPSSIYRVDGDLADAGSGGAGLRAKASVRASTEAGVGGELSTAELAASLNRHGRIVAQRTGDTVKAFELPPGEGMRAFYDRILPNIANDLGKKFGARTGETTIDAARESDKVYEYNRFSMEMHAKYGDGWRLKATEEEIARLRSLEPDERPLVGFQVKPETVHSLPITPEMREQALENGMPLFARGDGEGFSTVAELEARAAEEFATEWPALSRTNSVQIVDSTADVPAPMGIPPNVKAVHMRDTRTTYFVAKNIHPDEMRGLILHEVGVHHGMEAMLGQRGFKEVMRQIERMIEEDHPALVEARALAERYAHNDAHVPEETLAYLIETQADLPLVTRTLARIRQWLIKTFGSTFGMRLTVDDLRALAITSLRRVAEQARRESVDAVEVLPVQEAVFASQGPDASDAAARQSPDGGSAGAGQSRLTQAEIERHMRGYCGDLACALQARTGYPIEAVQVQGVKEHFMVRLPNGNLLDARGELTPEQAIQGDWFSRGQARIVPATREEVVAHHLREQGRNIDAENPAQYDAVVNRLLNDAPNAGDGGDFPLFSQSRQNRENLLGAKRDPIESPSYQRRIAELRSRIGGEGAAPQTVGRAGDEPAGVGGVRSNADARRPIGTDAQSLKDILAVSGVRLFTRPGSHDYGKLQLSIDTPIASEADSVLVSGENAKGQDTRLWFDFIDGSNPKEERLPGVHLTYSRVHDGAKGLRVGEWMYRQIIDWADRRGLPVYSDSAGGVSVFAQRTYARLEKMGYVVERVSRQTEIDPEDGAIVAKDALPVYRISLRDPIEAELLGADVPPGDYQIDGPTLRERQARIDEQAKRQAEHENASPAERILKEDPDMMFSMGPGRRDERVSDLIFDAIEGQREARAKEKAFDAAARCAIRHGGSMAGRSFVTLAGRGASWGAARAQMSGMEYGLVAALPVGYGVSHVAAQNADPVGYAANRARNAGAALEGFAAQAGLDAGLDAPTNYDEPYGEPLSSRVTVSGYDGAEPVDPTAGPTPLQEGPDNLAAAGLEAGPWDEPTTFSPRGGSRTLEGSHVPPAPPGLGQADDYDVTRDLARLLDPDLPPPEEQE